MSECVHSSAVTDHDSTPRKPAGPFVWLRGFVERQIGERATRGQVVFDTLFGVVAPVLLLVLDRMWDPLGESGVVIGRVYALPAAVGGSVLLLAWLRFGKRAHWLQAVLAGCFAAAAAVSCGVGLLLLPMTIIGLFVVIGVLGFVPFLSAFVFARNALRARSRALSSLPSAPAWGLAIVTGLLVLATDAAQGMVAKGIAWHHQGVLLGEEPGDAAGSLGRLRLLRKFPGVPLIRLERAYASSADDEELKRIDALYEELTGTHMPLPSNW